MLSQGRQRAVSAIVLVTFGLATILPAEALGQRRFYIPGAEASSVSASVASGAMSLPMGEEAYVARYLLERAPWQRQGLLQLKGNVFEATWQYRNNVRPGTPEYLPSKSLTASQNDMVTIGPHGKLGPAVQLKAGTPRYIVEEMLTKDTKAERFIVPDDAYEDAVGILKRKAADGQISQATLQRELQRLERGGVTNTELEAKTRTAVRALRFTPALGLKQAVWGGAIGGLLMGGADLVTQRVTTGQVDWRQVSAFTAVGTVGGFIGTYVGVQTQWLLMGPTARGIAGVALGSKAMIGLSRVGGMAGGSMAAGTVIALGLYVTDQISWEQFESSMFTTGAASVGMVVAPAVTAWAVATFGTASTGTAIGSLSGGAATNATLAWLGGGSIASGGGGVAAGAAVLTGVAIGGGLIFAVGMKCYHTILDEKREAQRIETILQRCYERVSLEAQGL